MLRWIAQYVVLDPAGKLTQNGRRQGGCCGFGSGTRPVHMRATVLSSEWLLRHPDRLEQEVSLPPWCRHSIGGANSRQPIGQFEHDDDVQNRSHSATLVRSPTTVAWRTVSFREPTMIHNLTSRRAVPSVQSDRTARSLLPTIRPRVRPCTPPIRHVRTGDLTELHRCTNSAGG